MVFTSVADAKSGDIESRGSCSITSKWKLKLRPKSRRSIEVDFDAENKVLEKQKWKIQISNNKKRVYNKIVQAGASIGDDSNDDDTTDDSVYVFDISTTILANANKEDSIVATATSTKTGEVCRGILVLP